ncbi:MAG TPA: pyridoxamine 5'-phosphate oxidase family protein [Chloroflexia bacterium]|nr:pyridoxamine 5'-phosphate oxidase family protein [Chloroflexia bacterium]
MVEHPTTERAPRRSRPYVPGNQVATGEAGMLEWSAVDAWLVSARVYWLGTASPDGAPHATPIWGAWVGGTLYFDGYYEKTRWGRNLAANPRLVVHIESGNRVVILQGVAAIVDLDAATFAALSESYTRKYDQPPATSAGVYSVRPQVAFAWDNDAYTRTATRWHFARD